MPRLAPLVFALSVTGCSSASPETSAEVTEANATIDAAEWKVFGTRAAARAWWSDRGHVFALVEGDGTALFPDDGPETVRVQRMVDAHWATVRALFPVPTPPPIALVIRNTENNAFAVFDADAQKTANVVVVDAGAISRSDADLDAALAHELGHVVTRNADPARAAAIEKFYKVGSPEPLGLLQADDAGVRSVLSKYVVDARSVGEVALPELDGVPVGSVYRSFLDVLAGARSDPTSGACRRFAASREVVSQIAYDAWTRGLTTLAPDASAKLRQATFDIETSTCIQPAAGVGLIEDLAALSGLPAEALTAFVPPEDRPVIAESQNELEAIYRLTRLGYARVRARQATAGFSSFRWYTLEEQADDFGLTLLFREGKDAVEVGLSALMAEPAEFQSRCWTTLAAGRMPRYDLSEPHHTGCYRLLHAKAFVAWMNAGGTGLTALDVLGTAREPNAGSVTRVFPRRRPTLGDTPRSAVVD